MKLVANSIGVDAGMIIVADADYFTERGHDISDKSGFLGESFEVENGVYNVKYEIPETWHGKLKGKTILEVKSGKIIVSDPCYIIDNDKWMDWLNQTSYGEKINSSQAFILDEMGGDGCYDVILDLKRKAV